MSDRQRRIYQSEGDRYEAMVAREDHQRNIPRALDEIANVFAEIFGRYEASDYKDIHKEYEGKKTKRKRLLQTLPLDT